MAFKILKKPTLNLESPQSLFRDLRNRKVAGLLEHQSKMIDNYINNFFDSKDIAFELPTGSGKTLVGLLIGEYRRLKFKEKVVYLCPTKQLVNQVVNQSKSKYGIKTSAFTGKFKNYSPTITSSYTHNDSIAVTTYSGFFNKNQFFKDADIVIFDDAHSADTYISSFWSIDINRIDDRELYLNLAHFFKNAIGDLNYERMLNDSPDSSDLEWIDQIPITKVIDKLNSLVSIIDVGICKSKKYAPGWSNIKDYLHACNIYISHKNILIKPLISPTQTFTPFSNAKQRIYMSATLGESGELERITGVDNIDSVPIPEGWDTQGLGRRFFIFPSASFEKDALSNLVIETIKKFDRSLMLVPDGGTKKKMRDFIERKISEGSLNSINIFDNKDFEETKENFVNSNGIAILAHRFDGIDFENDECRLEILYGLPRGMNLQEKFLSTKISVSVLFNERLRTRLTQAIGRCNRGASDYSVVCIIGNDIEKELIPDKKRTLLHPELQAEIKFGYEQSMDQQSIDSVLENVDIFLKHGDDWDSVDSMIIDFRDSSKKETNPEFIDLKNVAKHEVKYQYAIWSKNYSQALNEINKILALLNHENLKSYVGFWNYIGATVSIMAFKDGNYHLSENKSKYIETAKICSQRITWLNSLENIECESFFYNKNDDILDSNIENLEKVFSALGPGKKRIKNKRQEILKALRSSDGNQVELGIKELGTMLGFKSFNKNYGAAPDPYWIIENELCFVSESKRLVSNESEITADMIREAKTHEETLRAKEKKVKNIDEIYTVIISNSKKIHKDATNILKNLYYVNLDELIKFAESSLDIIEDLHSKFIEEGNLNWRLGAYDLLKINNITPKYMKEYIVNSPISKLVTK